MHFVKEGLIFRIANGVDPAFVLEMNSFRDFDLAQRTSSGVGFCQHDRRWNGSIFICATLFNSKGIFLVEMRPCSQKGGHKFFSSIHHVIRENIGGNAVGVEVGDSVE